MSALRKHNDFKLYCPDFADALTSLFSYVIKE